MYPYPIAAAACSFSARSLPPLSSGTRHWPALPGPGRDGALAADWAAAAAGSLPQRPHKHHGIVVLAAAVAAVAGGHVPCCFAGMPLGAIQQGAWLADEGWVEAALARADAVVQPAPRTPAWPADCI
jgi:hypothetical protein